MTGSVKELRDELLGKTSRRGTVIAVIGQSIKVSTDLGVGTYINPGNVTIGDTVTIVDGNKVISSSLSEPVVYYT